MSIIVMTEVWQHSQHKGNELLTLLAIADNADTESRKAWPGVDHLATKTRLSRSTTLRVLSRLEASGEISVTRREGRGNVYEIALLPTSVSLTRVSSVALGSSTAVTPEPSENRHLKIVQTEGTRGGGGHALAPARGPSTVNRARVTERERTLAIAVLDVWNAATGSNLISDEWLAKIICRIREHHELGVQDHEFLIQRALAHPWWDGPATPSVVYGNGAQFERTIVAATSNGNGKRKRRYGLGVSTGEIGDLIASLKEAGR